MKTDGGEERTSGSLNLGTRGKSISCLTCPLLNPVGTAHWVEEFLDYTGGPDTVVSRKFLVQPETEPLYSTPQAIHYTD
jgi:hypothetical protein